jgi:PIN domain nuclease of toxin-antitoxin system
MFELPLHQRDPFDRMLIATALSEGVARLTRNRLIFIMQSTLL